MKGILWLAFVIVLEWGFFTYSDGLHIPVVDHWSIFQWAGLNVFILSLILPYKFAITHLAKEF